MNAVSPTDIALVAFAALAPMVCFVYWFATTYITKKQFREDLDRLRSELNQLEDRVDTAESQLREGHALFAGIRTELSFIRANLTDLAGKLDKLFEPRAAEPRLTLPRDKDA